MGWEESLEEQKLLLNLLRVDGIGPARLRALINRFHQPSAILGGSVAELSKLAGITPETAGAILDCGSSRFGSEQIEKLGSESAVLLTPWHREYPELLRRLADAPVCLFMKGKTDWKTAFSLAIVGTRRPSEYGRRATAHLVSELVASGVTIVSGLARGVDTIAHSETLRLGGRTVAVLGSGLDKIYPAENRKLANRIVEQGALCSEFPFGTPPDAVNFPRRNRIISGLSAGTIVIEAGERSGALITAYQALDQNREVFALPGSIFSQNSVGCHRLIQQGAKLVMSSADILGEFPAQGDLFDQVGYDQAATEHLTEKQMQVFNMISSDPVHIDALTKKLGMPSGELLAMLLHFELQGMVVQLPGKLFVRA